MGVLAYMNESRKKVAVIGLGVTGRSCVRWLVHQGFEVTVFDTRDSVAGLEVFQREFPGVEVYCGALDFETLIGFEQLVCSPGVSVQLEAIRKAAEHGIEVVGDIELFARQVKSPIVAITGSNGKSTVTTLVGEMLKAANMNVEVAGNIGTPVLDLLGEHEKEVYVLELSSFQLETTNTLHAAVAVVLNLSPDHMDRYDSYEDYVEAKRKVYDNASVCIVNRDDTLVSAMMLNKAQRVVGFTLGEPATGDFGLRAANGTEYLCKGSKKLLRVDELILAGRHNVANALASLAICDSLKADLSACVRVLKSFSGLAHRSQRVAEIDKVLWINDSKGTNVGATIAAVDGMDCPVILIAGGQAKGQDFEPLAPILKSKAKAVVLFGQDAPAIKVAVADSSPVHMAANLQEAVNIAHKLATAGDSVLFSPACASFDMFRNYIERGEMFVRLVEELSVS